MYFSQRCRRSYLHSSITSVSRRLCEVYTTILTYLVSGYGGDVRTILDHAKHHRVQRREHTSFLLGQRARNHERYDFPIRMLYMFRDRLM